MKTFCNLFFSFFFSISPPLLQVNVDYTEKMVSISNYPLSAALTCAKITTAFEEVWGIVWASAATAVMMDLYIVTSHSGRALWLGCGPGAALGSCKTLQLHPCSFWSNETLKGLPHWPFLLLLKVPFWSKKCSWILLSHFSYVGRLDPLIAGTWPKFVTQKWNS